MPLILKYDSTHTTLMSTHGLFTCMYPGYLVVMIFYKWNTAPWTFPNQNPPSLLLMLINMFLQFGKPPVSGEVLYGDAVSLPLFLQCDIP